MMTNPILDDTMRRKKNKERIVEESTEKEYYVCGKKTNKNVWELQQLYETTQAKTTKVLPEFFERIRFMIVKGITKVTFDNKVDQDGELFNYVVLDLLRKIIPTRDPITNELTTKYDSTKTNLGAYILNSCYWSVISYTTKEQGYSSLLSSNDYLEDYEKCSEDQEDKELSMLKFISGYTDTNTYMPVIREMLKGDGYAN